MMDEQYIEEPVIAGFQVSPGETKAAVLIKKANLADNRYDWKLDLWDTADWRKSGISVPLEKGKFWWLSENELLLNREGNVWTVFELTENSGSLQGVCIGLPGDLSEVIPLEQNRFLLLVREEISQDTDYFETENLPFMEDGKGYITSFGALWCWTRNTNSLRRVVPERYEVQQAGSVNGRIWFSGYERDYSRVDFLHSGLYEQPLPADGKTSEPRQLLPDLQLRIDAAAALKDGIILAASLMKPYGPGQSPDFYFLDFKGELSLIAENRESAGHSVVRDWKSTRKRFQVWGDGLAFLSTCRGDVQLHFVDSGGIARCLIQEPGVIDDFYIFRDGRILAAGAYDWAFDELYLYEAQRKKRRKISTYHAELQEDELRPVRRTFFTEDQPVDLFVLPPRGFCPKAEPDRRYPAILTIHGGHKLAYGQNVLNIDFRLWSDEGYFVIFCNPRGSEGVNDDFANIIGNNGITDAEDILRAVDLALEEWPQIDPDRLGITGGSYGGYLTNWLITQTNRFACAVSVRGISNRISKELDSDTGFRYPLLRLNNRVWEDAEGFWQASPIKHIRNCRTPVLLIHSQGDLRCPVAEGIQMYTALKLVGVPAKLLIFSGGSHGLAVSGRPSARLKHSRAIRDWFNRYLK